MINLVIFDLDGVLYDSKKFHFEALNLALIDIDKKYEISYEDHLRIYDGLPTNRKLEILKEEKSIIEDLIVAAHNNAKAQLKSKTTEEISKATGGLGIPGFKWPL